MLTLFKIFITLIGFSSIKCTTIENLEQRENISVNYDQILTVPKIVDNNEKLIVETYENISPKRYDGSQVWRVLIGDDNERKTVNDLRYKFGAQTWMDYDNNIDILLNSCSLNEAENILKLSNLSHIVLIDDLQNIIDTENPPKDEIETLQNRKGHRMTWIAYHRAADIHGYLDYLAKTYPDICATQTIGLSSQNRPLKILKISNGKVGNKAIWIDGGIHAREWISPASVTYIIERLTENWDDLPLQMRNIDWFIHPLVNPDGYEYTHQVDRLWRKNRARTRGNMCTGVDLNRNFGFNWGGQGTSANSCSEIYRGAQAFSEPESLAIANFMRIYGKGFFKAYLSFHSYGQYILFPWGHDDRVYLPDHKEIDRVGKEAAANILKVAGARYTVGSSAKTLYPAAGGSDDWARGVLGVKYSYTVEMRDTGRYGFVLPAHQIVTNGKEAMAFVETIVKAVSSL